ncbi:hypothetical protein [Burkholderia anthina]|uniref:hypothetical protein n=1 Tax=Burkholderia anthina TaxID=179879 RepID=UPI0028F4501A|nr:hypothetical protein [Burkholderia anthina]
MAETVFAEMRFETLDTGARLVDAHRPACQPRSDIRIRMDRRKRRCIFRPPSTQPQPGGVDFQRCTHACRSLVAAQVLAPPRATIRSMFDPACGTSRVARLCDTPALPKPLDDRNEMRECHGAGHFETASKREYALPCLSSRPDRSPPANGQNVTLPCVECRKIVTACGMPTGGASNARDQIAHPTSAPRNASPIDPAVRKALTSR